MRFRGFIPQRRVPLVMLGLICIFLGILSYASFTGVNFHPTVKDWKTVIAVLLFLTAAILGLMHQHKKQ